MTTMTDETRASIAVREQYLAQLRRHEDYLADALRAGIMDERTARAITLLAVCIKGEMPR